MHLFTYQYYFTYVIYLLTNLCDGFFGGGGGLFYVESLIFYLLSQRFTDVCRKNVIFVSQHYLRNRWSDCLNILKISCVSGNQLNNLVGTDRMKAKGDPHVIWRTGVEMTRNCADFSRNYYSLVKELKWKYGFAQYV